MEELTGESSNIDISDVVKKATPKQIEDIFNVSVANQLVSSHAFRDVAINGIPKMNPLSAEYINWWKFQRNCCINGIWIGGRWMPGRLYFHANFFNIERTYAKNRSRKQLGLPDIRDVDWEIFTLIEIAKGLSGFDSFGNPIYDNDAQGFLMIGPRDYGKELADYEQVMTPNGSINIGDIKKGAKVFGKDGKVTTVTGVYPQGLKDIYRFTFSDGRQVDAGLEHLWEVIEKDKTKILTTKQILDNGYRYQHLRSGYSYRYKLPNIKPVEYSIKALPIHPYILGAMLGDGVCTTNTPVICSSEQFIINKFKQLLPNYEIKLDPYKGKVNKAVKHTIKYVGTDKYKTNYKNSVCGANPLYRELQALGCNKTCYEKSIPAIYKYGSIEQRFELIKGLMDTDGSINVNGSIEFMSVSKQLAEDVVYVLRSLGIRCQIEASTSKIGKEVIMPQDTKYTYKNIYYRVYIRTDVEIFSLPRKLNRQRSYKSTKRNNVSIVDITKLSEQHTATCITVDNEDKIFLTRDFIPTHNSVIGASNIAYEYTFFRNNHVLVSGFETKYTNPLLSKVRVGLDNMPGGLDFLDTYYPPPFSHQRLKNDWTSEVMSGRKVRRDGNEVTTGYQSAIFHRVFADNIMAANGLRVGFHVFEEIGAFDNLINSYNASVPCWRSGPHQFGVPYLVGTGGEMEKGTTNAQRMFYEPDTFNLLKFHNDYDKDGSQIAFFIPADRTQFFNDEGVCTPELRAKGRKFLLERRAKKKATDRSTYDNELMYYPLKPQEAFLSTNGNIFPRHLLEDQLTYLLSTKANTHLGTKGKLVDLPDGGVSFSPSEDTFEVDFPHTPGQKDEGAIVIYERPHKDENGQIPFGLYLGGIDPIDQDEAEGSLSLGSIFIYKRFVSADKTYDMVVAEYTGRFDKSEQFYDICRKLLIFYNAKGLYENMIKGLKQYFEMKGCLYLLKEQPNSLIKDIVPSSKVERGYGIHMTKEIKNYIIRLIADHLNTQYEPGKYNTAKLYQINLLKELIAYNDKGNFDRVIAFGLCLLHKEAMFKHKVEAEAEVTDVRKNYFNEYFKDHGF